MVERCCGVEERVLPCMWFVTKDSDILMRFRDEIACVCGRFELSFMRCHRLLALVPNTVCAQLVGGLGLGGEEGM
jgi:hypothetical protein